jgi:hypothetical protein
MLVQLYRPPLAIQDCGSGCQEVTTATKRTKTIDRKVYLISVAFMVIAMRCQDRDPYLLLFSLGDLSGWERWTLTRHLCGCRCCRARLRQLAALAAWVAQEIQPRQAQFDRELVPREGRREWPLPPARQPALVSLLLVLTLGLLLIYSVVWQNFQSHAPDRCAVPEVACRPDLPNDRCR